MNHTHFCRFRRLISGAGCLLALVSLTACDSPQPGDAAVKAHSAQPTKGLARLSPQELISAGIATEIVSKREFRSAREFPGTVTPNHHALADVTTLVRGRVVDVYADLGQQVKGGDLLAILYSGELGMAQSAYLKADAKLYVAERSYERAKMLLAEKVIGLAEEQRRKGELLTTQAEKREARDRLELYGMSDDQIRKLDRDHTIRSYVPIVAPFDGRVIARNLTKGEVVETTEKLFVVADLSVVWVLANIPEKDIPFIRPDAAATAQPVDILVNAYPDEVFHGKITYVGDVLDVATRTMNLRLELPNPDKKLKPEMFATIRVWSDPEPNVLMVPERAVQRDRERRFVFVQREPNVFEARDVRLGPSNGRDVKVLDGLLEGETVVTNGAFVLKSELFGEQI
ncbi:MAG: efflux RND transporter periplasmic adaptor subunit [Nitrospiraceae bacterium]|nr:efflux RND transporter periplasmic adaptor subunit [Nitrospiraceae bacterium]